MVAWGVGSFENDDAHDWLNDFCDDPRIAMVEEALTTVVEWNDAEYLEVTEAGAALAAAEIVAALIGKPCADLPEAVVDWVAKRKAKVDPLLMPLALQAIARVKSNSEMSDLWQDAATNANWRKGIADLEARLSV